MFAVIDLKTGEVVATPVSGRGLKTAAGETISEATLLSRAELLAKGVIPITDPGQPDPALYRVTGQRVEFDGETATLAYDAEAIPAADIRAKAIAAIKANAAALLAPSDWLVIRASETNAPIPAETIAYRGAVRAASNDAEAAIAAAGDDAAAILAAAIPAWPKLTEGAAE